MSYANDLKASEFAMEEAEGKVEPFMTIRPHLCQPQPISDESTSATSRLQIQTVQECLPLLNAVTDSSSNPLDFNKFGLPSLHRGLHLDFIHNGLQPLPASFVTMDASRPWLMYWSFLSLNLLGEDVKVLRHRLIDTFRPLQNASGGFGGGQGHLSHLACTYAAILAIAIAGGQGTYKIIDRKALWHWLGQLKQPSGGFIVCEDGEEDVRGAYCALVAISLLNLPWTLPNDASARASGMRDFRDELGPYLSRCQSFEGGISASQSNEAHGAYAFCALACLSILGPPHKTITNYLDLGALIRWLSARQYAPEGGFAGRTNKVVDGCYSHWIGGCWPLVEASLSGPGRSVEEYLNGVAPRIFSSQALDRYILGCCQAPAGGLRDKPSKRPDTYHTCYNLAGLSMTSFSHAYDDKSRDDPDSLKWTCHRYGSSQGTSEEEASQEESYQEVAALQPVYVIPHVAVSALRQWALSQGDVS